MANLDRDFFVSAFRRMAEAAEENRDEWTRLDGNIGDGDHGINMSKGFSQCGEALRAKSALPGLAEALDALAMTLLEGIGGSMGPLYGSFFLEMSAALAGKDTLAVVSFLVGLENKKVKREQVQALLQQE